MNSLATNNQINIVFSCDDNYAPYLSVAIKSIIENHKTKEVIYFFIIDSEISEERKELIKKQILSYGHKVEFIFINNENYNYLPTNRHFTVATWYRLLSPDLLNKLDKFLYLDVDVLVLKEISTLYNHDIESYLLAVIKDTGFGKRLDKYFNAGVLLFNADKWRKNNYTQKCLDFVKNNLEKFNNGIYDHVDQDVLNNIINKREVLFLPEKFNTLVMASFNFLKPWKIKRAVILHFVTTLKPWRNKNLTPLRRKYIKYWRKTKFSYLIEKKSFIERLKGVGVIIALVIKKFLLNG